MAKIKVTLVKSLIGRKKDHIATANALGLRKINKTVEHEDETLVKVKKDKTLDQAVELDQDLKVVKCHYTEDFLREDSLISSLSK